MQNWDKKWTIAAIAAVVLLVVGVVWARGASAADKGGPTFLPIPEIATKSAWTGCYIGASVGYGWQTSTVTKDDIPVGDTLKGLSFNADDFMLTPSLGCDVQMGSMVVAGIMADVTFSNLNAAYDSRTVYDVEWQWFVGGRIGVLPTQNALAYFLAGYTALDGGFNFDGGAPAGKTGDIKGLTLGGGLDLMVRKGWTMKTEYRWINGGNDKVDANGGGVADEAIETDIHQIRIGLTYRFGAN